MVAQGQYPCALVYLKTARTPLKNLKVVGININGDRSCDVISSDGFVYPGGAGGALRHGSAVA